MLDVTHLHDDHRHPARVLRRGSFSGSWNFGLLV